MYKITLLRARLNTTTEEWISICDTDNHGLKRLQNSKLVWVFTL